ncbi:MAG: adenylyl-sulfate kinase [Micromonosporaceae bacterium]
MGSSGWVLPEEVLAGAPTYTPRPGELADLELILNGAFAPLTGPLTSADLASLSRRGRLADGTPWSVPVTLEVPTDLVAGMNLANPLQRALVVTDFEGTPVAAVDVVDAWPTRDGMTGVGGPVRRISDPFPGPFASLRRPPAAVREQLPDGRVLGVVADAPLHRPQLAQIVLATRTLQAHLLVLIPVAEPTAAGLPPEALVRCVLAARDRMPAATIVTVPLRRRANEVHDALARARVAQAYGATHLLAAGPAMSGGGLRVLVPRELAYDSRDGQWRTRNDIPPHNQRLALSDDEIQDLLDRGFGLPEWHTPPAVAKELARALPPRRWRGLVLFVTGRSGSGKSAIARRVAAALRENGERTVTLLDADLVRRELAEAPGPAGAATAEDRTARRVGWVAAEVARHRGVAICSPAPPSPAALRYARAAAQAAGAGFVLVCLSTPADVCRRRARSGLVGTGTREGAGIDDRADDRFHEPADADLVLDTTDLPVEAAVAAVLEHLTQNGWIEP